MYKVAETYIRYDMEYSDVNRAKLYEIYLSLLSEFPADSAIGESDYKISIEFEKGSLKSRVVIWTSSIILAISSYGSFRTGIISMYNDSRAFSDKLITLAEKSQPLEADILRSERRTGIVGRVEELYRRVDLLEKQTKELSIIQIEEELGGIKQEIANIQAILNEPDREEFLADLGEKYTEKLPVPDEKRVNYLISRYGLKSDERIDFIDDEK